MEVMALAAKKSQMNFAAMSLKDVPQGRNGKHKDIVKKILSDLERVADSGALKVPLAELPAGKEKVRSALNRATRKKGIIVATASDDAYLYVWNERS
jgi:hypothetical protein